jgi:hypothetical protein
MICSDWREFEAKIIWRQWRLSKMWNQFNRGRRNQPDG